MTVKVVIYFLKGTIANNLLSLNQNMVKRFIYFLSFYTLNSNFPHYDYYFQYYKNSTMAASADKVQYILQTLLQQSISLVKRGIFTQIQLREMMHRRQKCENSMLKKTFKVTDYLGAIQYQYDLERQRRFRMDQLAKLEDGHSSTAFRKESSSDFVIVKRIIRLWDRTMHKYKFKLHLWKQYLKFCITISSKKHFYKTLTKALRFLPFETDLWKIGVEYQKQVGHNLWKARKILIKALKMVSAGAKNVQLGQYMIRFEIDFLKAILKRRQIISKGEEALKFIGGDQEQQQSDKQDKQGKQAMDNIDLSQYDEILWIVIEQIFRKNHNEQIQPLKFNAIKDSLSNLLRGLEINNNNNGHIKQILNKTQNRLKNYLSTEQLGIKIQNDIQIQQKLEQQPYQPNEFDNLAINNTNSINFKVAQGLIKKKCLNPLALTELYQHMLDLNFSQAAQFILSYRKLNRLPAQVIFSILKRFDSQEDCENYDDLKKWIQSQIDKLQGKDYKANINLLKAVIQFNSNQKRLNSTTKIMRSLSILYKNEPQFLQMCNKLSNCY